MSKVIHRIVVNDDAEMGNTRSTQRNIESSGSVSGGQPSVEPISTGPGETTIQGQYRGLYADKLALEFEELFDASDISEVALTELNGSSSLDGYYSLAGAQAGPAGRDGGNVYDFTGRMTKKGTRKSHWRAITTNHAEVDNDFGNETTARVGVPAAAQKVRWFSQTDKTTEPASVQSTVTTEHGDVDMYEATASTYSRPTLIFEMPYVEEGKTSTKVWDANGPWIDGVYGTNYGTYYGGAPRSDGDGNVQWQRVFRSNHDFLGREILSNGKLRLILDEENQTVSAENYSSGSWSSVDLGSTSEANSWSFFDLDLVKVSMNEVEGQVLWEKDDGTLFALQMSLKRGYEGALWFLPGGETGPAPTGLQDKLDPIADDQTFDVQSKMTLVRRGEVRK